MSKVRRKLDKVARHIEKDEAEKALKLAIKLDAKCIQGLGCVKDAVINDINEFRCAKLFNMAHDYAAGRSVIKDESKTLLILMVLVSVGYAPALEVIEEVA